MKASEAIERYRSKIADAMKEDYRAVLECNGKVQCKIYVWEDGEIEELCGPQGDNGWLQAKQYEPRELFYVCTVSAPFFDPWDYSDHAAPENDEEREQEEKEIIDWLCDEYCGSIDETIDNVIKECVEQEKYDEERWKW